MKEKDDPFGGLKCLGCKYSDELYKDDYCPYVFCKKKMRCVPKGDECEEWKPKRKKIKII